MLGQLQSQLPCLCVPPLCNPFERTPVEVAEQEPEQLCCSHGLPSVQDSQQQGGSYQVVPKVFWESWGSSAHPNRSYHLLRHAAQGIVGFTACRLSALWTDCSVLQTRFIFATRFVAVRKSHFLVVFKVFHELPRWLVFDVIAPQDNTLYVHMELYDCMRVYINYIHMYLYTPAVSKQSPRLHTN